MYVRVGPQRRLSTKELMLLNCGAREDSWIASRSNQSILKEINPEYSLQGLLLKLKFHSGHLMWRASSLEKPLMLGEIEGQRRRRWQRMRWFDSITNSMDMKLSKLLETVKDKGAWCVAIPWVKKSQTWLSNWTTIAKVFCAFFHCKNKIETSFKWLQVSNKFLIE